MGKGKNRENIFSSSPLPYFDLPASPLESFSDSPQLSVQIINFVRVFFHNHFLENYRYMIRSNPGI